MLGEMFFKDNDDDRDDDNDDLEEYTEDTEHLPYQVILKNEVYISWIYFILFHDWTFHLELWAKILSCCSVCLQHHQEHWHCQGSIWWSWQDEPLDFDGLQEMEKSSYLSHVQGIVQIYIWC